MPLGRQDSQGHQLCVSRHARLASALHIESVVTRARIASGFAPLLLEHLNSTSSGLSCDWIAPCQRLLLAKLPIKTCSRQLSRSSLAPAGALHLEAKVEDRLARLQVSDRKIRRRCLQAVPARSAISGKLATCTDATSQSTVSHATVVVLGSRGADVRLQRLASNSATSRE